MFENFKLLKKDMEDNGWILEAFNFEYKSIRYIVLVKLYLKNEKKPEYALLKTEILKADDLNYNLTLPVNSKGFMTDAKTLREFFNIEYSENLGAILEQFNENFSKFIPTQINLNKSDNLKRTMIFSLSQSDSEDPNKIYCFTVKRNPNKINRTPFNDNKTRLLRPNLYTRFKEDITLSFCYSSNIKEEKTDEEILLDFSKRTY